MRLREHRMVGLYAELLSLHKCAKRLAIADIRRWSMSVRAGEIRRELEKLHEEQNSEFDEQISLLADSPSECITQALAAEESGIAAEAGQGL